MKRKIYFKGLPVLFFVFALILNPGNSLAQGITTYQYRHVAPDKMDEFVKRETTYWSKVARKAIDNGKLTFWALFVKVGALDEQNSPNVIFVNTYPDIDENMGDVWNPTKLFPGVPMNKISTDEISTTTALIFVKSGGWQQIANANPEKDFKYVKMNYHNSTNPSSFNSIEVNNWGPFIKEAMDNKQTDQKAWGNALVLSPNGGQMKYNCLSYDLYANLNDALVENWSSGTKFPITGLDSLQKISLNPPISFIYRIVKVESKN